jgi:hypothetical protein
MFTRQTGGASGDPIIGSDPLPTDVATDVEKDNAHKFSPKSANGFPVTSIAVGVASSASGSVTVEVYIGDETRNVWFLSASQSIPVGQIRRFAMISGPGTTSVPVYVRPLAAGAPATGVFRFMFGSDQADSSVSFG